MNRHSIAASFVAASALIIASTTAVAAEPGAAADPSAPASGAGRMPDHRSNPGGVGSHGSMHGDMGGMMGMMHSCQSMMSGAKEADNPMALRLPPGNEKLELQMHAEMMQKMGEIAARYADKIREAR